MLIAIHNLFSIDNISLDLDNFISIDKFTIHNLDNLFSIDKLKFQNLFQSLFSVNSIQFFSIDSIFCIRFFQLTAFFSVDSIQFFQLAAFALINPGALKQATTQMRQQRVHTTHSKDKQEQEHGEGGGGEWSKDKHRYCSILVLLSVWGQLIIFFPIFIFYA